MRLSLPDISAIRHISSTTFLHEFKLYLFGSRVNDSLKGGDIDLMMVLKPEDQESALQSKYQFLAQLKNEIGYQKIDLIIVSNLNHPFTLEVLPTAILLAER